MSFGGVAFVSTETYQPGDTVVIEYLPPVKFGRQVSGQVMWSVPFGTAGVSRKRINGMKFLRRSMFLRARLLEQVCSLEASRLTQRQQYGRKLTSQAAAEEWISKFANSFPR